MLVGACQFAENAWLYLCHTAKAAEGLSTIKPAAACDTMHDTLIMLQAISHTQPICHGRDYNVHAISSMLCEWNLTTGS